MNNKIIDLVKQSGGHVRTSMTGADEFILIDLTSIDTYTNLVKKELIHRLKDMLSIPGEIDNELDTGTANYLTGYDTAIADAIYEIMKFDHE